MPQDNTLGAPTEGLGQTVTFTANGDMQAGQAVAAQRGQLRTQASGGGQFRPQMGQAMQAMHVQEARTDPTFAALAKLGSAVLRPAIEAERTAAFFQGQQKAAAGQAIQEIVDEQPWFSQMFGSTNLVDGARAYTASARAVSVATELETNMPELRKLGGDEFAQHANAQLQKSLTGDGATDAVIMQQYMQQLPSIMRSQTKANLAYKTEVMGSGIEANTYSNLQRVVAQDAAFRDPTRPDGGSELIATELEAIKAFVRPADMSPIVFNKHTSAAVIKAITEGGHAAYDLVKSSGVFSEFSPEQQQAIEYANLNARRRSQAALPLEFGLALGEYRRASADATNPEAIVEHAARINAQYTQLTGDRQPFVPTTAVASEIDQWYTAQLAESRRLQQVAKTTAAGAAKEQAKADASLDLVSKMGLDYNVTSFTKDEKEAAWGRAAMEWGEGSDKLTAVRVRQAGLDNPDKNFATRLQGMILQAATGSASNEAGSASTLYSAYIAYKQVLDKGGDAGYAAAQIYAGDGGKIMDAYHRMASGKQQLDGHDIQMFYSAALQQATALDSKVPQKHQDELALEFTTGTTMRAWHSAFGDGFPTQNPKAKAALVSRFARPDLSPENSAAIAVTRAKEAGVYDELAGHGWGRLPSQSSFSRKLLEYSTKTDTVSAEFQNRAFANGLQRAQDAVGIVELHTIVQLPDRNGSPVLGIMGATASGALMNTHLTVDQVTSYWQARLNPPEADTYARQAYNRREAQRNKPK